MAESNLLMSGKAQSTDPVMAENAVGPLSLNGEGHLRVAAKQVKFPTSSANLSGIGNVLNVDVADASNVMIHVKNTGTANMVVGTFIFEGSLDSTDGSNGTWFTLQGVRSDSNVVETGTTPSLSIGSGSTYSWELSVNAVKWFRVRCTSAVSSSSVATWTAIRGSYATEPVPAIQPHGISGTVTVGGTVAISGTPNVSVTNTPAVTISGTPSVSATITGTPNVAISGTPAVTATTTPGSATFYSLTSAATNNAAVIKASAGALFELCVFNSTAAAIWVRLYNKATTPSPAGDTAIVVIPVAAGAFVNAQFGAVGKRFSAGISIATTAAAGNNDNTSITAGAIISGTFL